MTLTLDTKISSPRTIANGEGAWEGALRELLSYTYDREEQVIDHMIAEGRLAVTESEHLTYGLEGLIDRLTLADVQTLCDDPNATIEN